MKHGKGGMIGIVVITAVAVCAVAAAIVLFLFLRDVPTVSYEKEPVGARYVARSSDYTFFDPYGNKLETVTNIRRRTTNDLGTMLALSTNGTLYLADENGARTIDTGVSGTHIFALADDADIAFYEKEKKIYRYAGAPEHIGTLEGIEQSVTVSPDGSSAVWCESVRQELKLYAYRGDKAELLTGADSVVSVSGGTILGRKADSLVLCESGGTSFRTVCGCSSVKGISRGGEQLLVTDGTPSATYLYDFRTGGHIQVYNGTVTPYTPEGMRQKSGDFELFIGEAIDHTAGTYRLMRFELTGGAYKAATLLDLAGVSTYRVSADGKKLLFVKNGKLMIKSLIGALAKDNEISDKAAAFCADAMLENIYFTDFGNSLFYSDGGSPKKITLNVGIARMMSDGVCTFISDGILYYSEHGGSPQKASGIVKASMLSDTAAVDENDVQYITLDGKNFTDTGIKRI